MEGLHYQAGLISFILTDGHVPLKQSNRILAWLRYHDSVLPTKRSFPPAASRIVFQPYFMIHLISDVDGQVGFFLFGGPKRLPVDAGLKVRSW